MINFANLANKDHDVKFPFKWNIALCWTFKTKEFI